MKTNLLLIVLAIATGFGATLFFGNAPSPEKTIKSVPVEMTYDHAKKGDKVPDVQLTTIDGKVIHLDDLLDHTILMNFWASWCTPCIVELPDLLKLARNHPNMVLILLSSDLTEDALKKHVAKLPTEDIQQSNVIIAWDERGKITRDVFQTFQLPETVLIDQKGYLRHKFVGVADWESDAVLKIIRDL